MEKAQIRIIRSKRKTVALEIRWEYDGAYAELHVNFEEGTYTIESN